MAEDDTILVEEKKAKVKKKIKKTVSATDTGEDITLQTRQRFETLLLQNLETTASDILKKKKKKKEKTTCLEEAQEENVAESFFTTGSPVSLVTQPREVPSVSGLTKDLSPRKPRERSLTLESEIKKRSARRVREENISPESILTKGFHRKESKKNVSLEGDLSTRDGRSPTPTTSTKGRKKVNKKSKPPRIVAGSLQNSKDLSSKENEINSDGDGDDDNDDDDGKGDNPAYTDDQDTERRGPKKGKKKKVKGSLPQNRSGENSTLILDEGKVLTVIVHRTDKLKNDFSIIHPLVRVHVVDENTGQYLLKQSSDRPVTFYYESKSLGLRHILPMMTQPFDFKLRKSTIPVWEEVLLFNENYNYFIQSKPKVILFFEILDFVSMNSASFRYQRQPPHEGGWYKVAWAFLKVIGANQKCNTNSKVRLQLYQPGLSNMAPITGNTPEVFLWWRRPYRMKYPSTLYVTIKKSTLPDVQPSLRSMFATQEEVGMSTPGAIRGRHEATIETKKSKVELPIWSRLDGQTCRIPNTPLRNLKTGWNGCYSLKFSHDGRKIALGCQDSEEYPVLVYEVITGRLVSRFLEHFGLIYAVCWSTSDQFLCTASADGTARVWSNEGGSGGVAAKQLPHPAYVYSCCFHVKAETLVVTGGYDEIIRIWNIKEDSKYGELLQEIESHKGYVNALCFDERGGIMYSADSMGNILMWNCYFGVSRNEKAFVKDWTLQKDISISDYHGIPINSLTLHCSGRRLLVHYRDSVIRMVNLRLQRIMQKYIGALNFRKRLQSTLTPCSSYLFSGSEDNVVYVWNTETGDQVYKYTALNYQQPVTGIDYHPKDHIVAFCSPGRNQVVRLYKYIPVEVPKSDTIPNKTMSMLSATPPIPPSHFSRIETTTDKFDVFNEVSGQQLEDRIRYEKIMRKLNTVSALSPSFVPQLLPLPPTPAKLKEQIEATLNSYPVRYNTNKDGRRPSTNPETRSEGGSRRTSLSSDSRSQEATGVQDREKREGMT